MSVNMRNECPACGTHPTQWNDTEAGEMEPFEIRQCPRCGGDKCPNCDMGDDVACISCEGEEPQS